MCSLTCLQELLVDLRLTRPVAEHAVEHVVLGTHPGRMFAAAEFVEVHQVVLLTALRRLKVSNHHNINFQILH